MRLGYNFTSVATDPTLVMDILEEDILDIIYHQDK